MSKKLLTILGVLSYSTAEAATTDYIGTDSLRLKPAVSVGGEYRSNLYLDSATEGTTTGTALLVNPVIALETNSQVLKLKLGSGYGARVFMQESLQNLNSFNDGLLRLNGRILPNSKAGISFSNGFSSNNRPVNLKSASSSLIRVYNNKAKGAFVIGGGILDLSLGGMYNFQQVNGLEDSSGVTNVLNKKNTVGGTWNLNWAFLPKTNVFIDGAYYKNAWENASFVSTTDENCTTECSTAVADSSSWNTDLGLQGQISSKTMLKVTMGTGGSTYEDLTGDASVTASADSVSGLREGFRANVGLNFYPTPAQQITLSLKRAFQDVYFTNYEIYHQANLGYSVDVLQRMTLEGNFQYRNDNYDGPVDRTDHRVSASFETNFQVQKHLSLNAGVNWRRLASADGIAAIEYDDIGATVNLRFGY